MGAWGFNILENDASADGYGDYVDHMNAGLSHKQAMAKILTDYDDLLEDPDDAAYLWLGVAKAQWEYGHIEKEMIQRVEAIATSDAHLSEWDDAGPKGREKRRKVIEGFAAKLRSPNPRPKKPRKARLRKPVYPPGTCLAIARPDGRFLAGLVTFHLIENPDPGQDTYGINTVVLLDYLNAKPPTIEVFERRDWVREEETHPKVKPWLPVVRMCFANWHRKEKDTLTVVGQVKLTRADALEPKQGDPWRFRNAEELIARWRKHRNRPNLLIASRMEDVPAWQKILAKTEEILREGDPDRPPRKTLEQLIDLSPLQE